MTKLYKKPCILSIVDGCIGCLLIICFFPIVVIYKVLKGALM